MQVEWQYKPKYSKYKQQHSNGKKVMSKYIQVLSSTSYLTNVQQKQIKYKQYQDLAFILVLVFFNI